MKLRHRQALKQFLKNPAKLNKPILIDDLETLNFSNDFFEDFHNRYLVVEEPTTKKINFN